VTRRATPKLLAYATVSAVGLLAALVSHRPELAAAAVPFALLLTSLVHERPPNIDISPLSLGRARALEGERVAAGLTLRSSTQVDRLEVRLLTPRGLAAEPAACGLTMSAGEERALSFDVHCRHWGGYRLGEIALAAGDRHGLFDYEGSAGSPATLRVYPRAEALRSMIVPRETQPYAGNLVARRAGSGIEFADVRPFQPGDQVRTINWRASARRNMLLVSERHLEQNSDVIIFLDTFAELRGLGASSLDMAVRAAASLAARYLDDKDRVGMVAFGGVLKWLMPGGGLVQLYQIVEALLTTDIVFSYAWKNASVIPRRMLPANALIVALTPLLDDRGAQALLDLRARGYDIAVVEISPSRFLGDPRTDVERLARKLWQLQRDSLRLRYRRVGISVAEWRGPTPFDSVVEEVRRSRRFGRIARVS
jgi:uncharacterized protein (DUF58 family)